MPRLTVHIRSANLWFRMGVPERLRDKVGRSEIKLSLRTSNPAKARIRHNHLQAEWRQRFLAFDREIEAASLKLAPLLVERTLAALGQGRHRDETAYCAMMMLSFRLVMSWGRDFYEQSDARFAFGGSPEEGTGMNLAAMSTLYRWISGRQISQRSAPSNGQRLREAWAIAKQSSTF